MLVIKSGKDIRSGNISSEMNIYGSVMIREGKTTTKDMIGIPKTYCAYGNPRWDHEVKFSLKEKLVPEGSLTLVVKLIMVRDGLDKDLGEVKVPIQKIFELNLPSPSLNNGDDSGMSLVTGCACDGFGQRKSDI